MPCLYSPAPTTTPSTSASNPLKPATESRSRTSVSVSETVVERQREHHDEQHKPDRADP